MDTKGSGRILGFCGSCIAFYIGAGFATMQEIMQYEVSYGKYFVMVIAVAALIYIYTNLSFAYNGNRLHLRRGGDIYQVYCGKYIGAFFDYFSAFFCYMCFIVMCGGANSTAMEQWGLHNGIGAVILTVAVIATVLFGLEGILNTLSKLGPVIIVFILTVAAITAVSNFGDFKEGLFSINTGVYEIEQVGNGNPILSGASYGGFVILWFASFLSEVGAKNKLKEVNIGMLLSSAAIFGTAFICCVALIANIDSTWNVGIPALILASSLHPFLAALFAVIIFCGIYTSAVPLLWTGIRKISEDGTTRYKIYTIIGGIIGCAIACFFPYKGLLNILYGLNGYMGFILVAFMIVNDLSVFVGKK